MSRLATGLLPRACVCGHDHFTHRGEHVELCVDCDCGEEIPRCQNCGEEASTAAISVVIAAGYDVCSRRCALQVEYATRRNAA